MRERIPCLFFWNAEKKVVVYRNTCINKLLITDQVKCNKQIAQKLRLQAKKKTSGQPKTSTLLLIVLLSKWNRRKKNYQIFPPKWYFYCKRKMKETELYGGISFKKWFTHAGIRPVSAFQSPDVEFVYLANVRFAQYGGGRDFMMI